MTTSTKKPIRKRPTTIIPSEHILEKELHLSDEEQEETSEQVSNINEKQLLEQFLSGASQEEEIKDIFSVDCKDIDNSFVKEVHLPKFLMTGTKVGEKGNMFIVFEADPSVYSTLLKVLSKGHMKELKINLLSDTGEILTQIFFPSPTIKAIDFGSLMRTREDERELKIEIDFEEMKIGNVSFSF